MAGPRASMKPGLPGLLGAVMVLALLGLGYYLSQNLIREPQVVEKPYSGKARFNPFYAAERLLTRLGVRVRSVRDPAALPATLGARDTLLLAMPGYALAETRIQALLEWVRAGGHLLFTVDRAYEPGRGVNGLLDAFAIRVLDAGSVAAEPVKVQMAPGGPPLTVRFSGEYYLQPGGEVWRAGGDGRGYRLLQYRSGQGRVTVLSDLDPFTNSRLAEHDHAELLWALLDRAERRGAVWLQYIPWMPSLARMIWERAWMPVVALLITLALAIWAFSGRLGPLLVGRAQERRSLLEHIQAGGRFLWHHGARQVLLEAVRQRIVRKLERRLPPSRCADPQERIARLAALSGLAPAQVSAAMEASTIPSEREFLIHIQCLRQIEKNL